MKKIISKSQIIFLPICWFTEVIYQIKYNQNISGHDYIEQNNGILKCQICGRISK